jgi:DNA-directed RNA polymerase subunit M/transcription elongation factor TFIIS
LYPLELALASRLPALNAATLKPTVKKKTLKAPPKSLKHSLQQQVITLGKDDEVDTMPKMRMECPKCGHMEVYVWQVQTRGGDEASTQFSVAPNATTPSANIAKLTGCFLSFLFGFLCFFWFELVCLWFGVM